MRLVKFRGKWAAYHGRKRYSLRTADKAVADQRFEDFKRHVHKKKETVGEIVDAYLEAKKDKPSVKGMSDAWKAARPYFGNLRPDQINRALCRDYVQRRQQIGVSTGTIRKELGVIRQAIRYQDPKAAPQIELPPSPPPKERYLTKQEARRLEESCQSSHLRLFIKIALLTGARRGAILDLTWKRVDFEKDVIDFSKGQQTNKRRAVVKMNDKLRDALKAAKEDSASAFVISLGGDRVKSINRGFRMACCRASGGVVTRKGMTWGKDESWKLVTPHTLRHTAAVWMAEAGRSMSEIAQVLGHTSDRITFKVYARYSPDYLKDTVAALEY
jgi:integrase